ncbi:uncharacterized protein BXZ73DRAFT_39840 [Epithele typhae]|uniref:uncharacterized protein n=1 Tax=Epithele typhae TaxID=378194 RepID=UPI00200742A8|nr:uncharacterized protein BXZ73DRAFT_39840 [Epithele typhae]KAH9944369.1 hypothetical protein BXZ73DRAFT_39840 [Epithele typhae]
MTVGDGEPTVSIPVGIVIGLLASFVQSLGLTIQRKSHVLNQALPEEEQKPETRRPLWLLGFAVFISSNLFGSVVQIASLPVVILAPLGAVSLLWNAFFARLLLGDVFSPWMVLGTLLIAGGAVLIAIFGILPEPTHSLEDLLRLFSRPAFIAYFSLLGVVVLVVLATTHIVEYSYARRFKIADVTPPLSPLAAPATAPSVLTIATTASHALDPSSPTERTPLIDRKPHPRSKSPSPSTSISSMITSPLSFTARSPRTPLFLASSYASISGILSGMCLLFAKSGVELLLLTLGGDNQFWRWQAWMLVIALVVFALLQLWYMHKSLVLADPTLVCPLAFCFYNLSSIVNGLVYFDEFSELPTYCLLLVLLGIAVLLAGVWIISFPPEGGRGVDIGAWTSGDPPTELMSADEDIDVEGRDDEPYEDEPLPMDEASIVETSRGRSPPLEIVTEPPTPTPAPQLSPRLPVSPAHSKRRTPGGHGRLQTDTALLASPPPRSLSAFTTSTGAEHDMLSDYQSGVTGSGTRRRRTTMGGATLPPSSPPFLNPLSPNHSGIGGFSIGLSPISPGFSIVPRERRRRPTASGLGTASGHAMSGSLTMGSASGTGTEQGGQEGESEQGGAGKLGRGMPNSRSPLKMRRVVSEGDAERRTAAAVAGSGLPYGTDLERGDSEGALDARHEGEGGGGSQAQGAWTWLRGVFHAESGR